MTDKPILFSAPMIRALLAGTKTQTRRKLPSAHPKFPELNVLSLDVLIDPQQVWYWDGKHDRVGASYRLPIAPGDRLWVKETWRGSKDYDAYPPREMSHWPVHYDADGAPDERDELGMNGRTRSPIHMPRWASRLTLTVTDVRVQRLQEISEADAVAEGCTEGHTVDDISGVHEGWSARTDFRALWNSIHGPDAWNQNPWVAAYSFTIHRGNIDQMDT
ncbi:MAG: hypothetical protein ACEPO2_07395 [Pelagibaca sp.]